MGGPIVMLQIENEYGNLESYYGPSGKKYVEWLSSYALSLDVRGTPWIMCQQGEGVGTPPVKEIINTCNGYYCDNWISSHAADFPNQPHMWTENWPGWFQKWGEAIPHRPAVDVAFSVARWFARGGSYMNYYMAFGGTNFGRTVGGPLIVTSYDYDVQVNEFGLRAEPKFSLLEALHTHLSDSSEILLSQMPPAAEPLSGRSSCESHRYENSNGCVAFLSNWDEHSSCDFSQESTLSTVTVPTWSVTLMGGANCSQILFNTKESAEHAQKPNKLSGSPIPIELAPFSRYSEAIPSVVSNVISSQYPLEQLSLTHDSTDYLWYSTDLPKGDYSIASHHHLELRAGISGGAVMYFFVDGKFAGSTIDSGSPPEAARKSAVRSYDSRIQELTDDVLMINQTLTIAATTSSRPRLDILSVSMGLKNYGPYLEKTQVGVISNITFDEMILSGFMHSVGLQGESEQWFDQPPASGHEDSASTSRVQWLFSSFYTPEEVLSNTCSLPLALDLSHSLGKGSIWVNGHMLGRYWNVTANSSVSIRDVCSTSAEPPSTCTSAAYTGSYSGDRCRTGCGQPSQSWYKLPSEWLNSDRAAANAIVILEEIEAAAPESISLVLLKMDDL